MEIKWNNVFAALFGLLAVIILVNNPAAIGRFLGAVQEIGKEPQQTVEGLIAAGLCAVFLVAMVKLLVTAGK